MEPADRGGAPFNSYAVIVPVLNRENELAATLRSIGESLAYFDAHHPRSNEIAGEVVVVDEGSSDGTVAVVEAAATRDRRVRLIRHARSYGIGPARNTGVRIATGDVLFFCDGDDLFLPEHVFVGFSLLEMSADAPKGEVDAIRIRVGGRGHLALTPGQPLAAVRTGVRLKDAIRPEWAAVVQGTITQCLCVRRDCHDWVEGFPEEAVYKQIGGCEDGAYAIRLETFFRVGVIDLETVEYIRRPGNGLDVQMLRFTHPPGSEFDVPALSDLPIHETRRRIEHETLGHLLDKWNLSGPPRLPPALINWPGVIRELVERRRLDMANAVVRQARRAGQELPDEVMALLDRLRQASVEAS
jgi:GT2 family glycosyltransferase